MSRVTAVVSDFGGVLTSPLLDSFAHVQEAWGIPLDALGGAMVALTEKLGVNPLFELETGRLTEADFLRGLGEELTVREGRPVEVHGLGAQYFAHLQPNEPMISFMRSLREQGLRMAICTNNVREWEALWRAMLPVDEIFETVVDSAWVGIRKPDPEIYRITLDRLRVPPGEAVLVDDIEVNCMAAREYGMHAVQFRETEQAIAEIEALLAT